MLHSTKNTQVSATMGVNSILKEVQIIMSEEKLRMLRPGSFPAYLLMLVALSGEFPTTLTHRLPASKSYADFVVKGLKRDSLLRTYY